MSPVFADDDDDDDDDDGYSPISACGTIIDMPGHYRLVNDLVDCDVPDPLQRGISYGVSINSDNVVLDLGGHTISCADSGLFSFGVFTEAFKSRIRIQNGIIQSCNLGLNLNQSHRSAVQRMTLTDNGAGIEVLGGADNTVRNNRVLGSFSPGVIATSFFFGDSVGPGSRHRFHKNLLAFNDGPGIEANGIEDAVISCNRADRNLDGILFFDTGTGNKVTRNVTNNNASLGIGMLGFDLPPFFVAPIAKGNTIKRNTAAGNGGLDFGEFIATFSGAVVGSECFNSWSRNAYGTQFALPGCIAPPVHVDSDDDDGCAPRMKVFDPDDDDNLLKDPSFEMRLRPDEGGWALFDPFTSRFNFLQARSGHQSLFNASAGGSGSVQALPATPGSRWRLIGYGLTAEKLQGEVFGIVQFTFRDKDGKDIGTVETAGQQFPALPSNPVDGTSPAGEWIFLDTGVGTAPPGAVTLEAFTLFIDFTGATQGVFFDDLKLCALEPGEEDCKPSDIDDDDDDDDEDDD